MCFKLFNASSAFSNGGIFERRLNVVNDCLNAPAVASGNKEDNDGLNDRRNDLTYHDKTDTIKKLQTL